MGISFPKDPLSWDDWTSNIDSLQLSAGDKERARSALEYFKKALGGNFLRKIESSRRTAAHAFWGLLANLAPWTRLELIALADDMKSVEGSLNLATLLKSFEDKVEYPHSELVVRSAARLTREGLQTTFEPTLPVTNRQKQPDIKLVNQRTGETAFLEVTIQQPAKSEREALETRWRVTETLFGVGPRVKWSGRVRTSLAKPHLKELLTRINLASNRAATVNGFEEITEQGSYEFLFCNEEKQLLEWCGSRDLRPGEFQGPHAAINHTERLKSKIAQKQDQLPKDKPGSILILDSDVFFRAADPRTLIPEIEEEVYKHQHLGIVVVQGGSLSEESPEVIHLRQHRYTCRTTDRGAERFIVLRNRFSTVPPSEDLLSKFWRAFT